MIADVVRRGFGAAGKLATRGYAIGAALILRGNYTATESVTATYAATEARTATYSPTEAHSASYAIAESLP